MVKIEIRKKLVSKPSVIYGYNDNDTIGEDKFIPIYIKVPQKPTSL